MQTTHQINIRTAMYSESLFARKLWEKLFRLVHAETFASLDSFLCDLAIFQRLLVSEKPFFWTYDSRSGYTNVTEFDPKEPCYKIQRSKDYITISKF